MYLKFKQLGLLMLASAALTACSLENMEVPKDELYNRDFIKTFGLIDPNQNWNLVAQRAAKANGRSSNTFASRTVQAGNDLIKIEVLSGEHSYLTLTEKEIKSFNKEEYLPESNAQVGGGLTYANSNLAHTTVTNGFFVKGSTDLWIFPQYWDTYHHTKNRVGIYYYVEGPADPANLIFEKEITHTDGTKEKVYVKLVTIFDGSIKELQTCDYSTVTSTELNELNDIVNLYYQAGVYVSLLPTYMPEKYKIENGQLQYKKTIINDEGIETVTGDWLNPWSGSFTDVSSTIMPDLMTYFPGKFEKISDEKYLMWGDPTLSSVGKNCSEIEFTENGIRELRSTGVHVAIDKTVADKGFGFFLNQPNEVGGEYVLDRIFFSEHKLNKKVKFHDTITGAPTDEREVTYVSTFVPSSDDDKYDTAGNIKRYLCFEDWVEDNFDLNDVVFRLYGIEAINKDIPGGDIIPDTPTDPDPTDKDELIEQGLLVCEDLGVTDDIDFNDVILKLEHYRKTTTEGENTTTSDRLVITPMAAGGTLRSTVIYDDKAGTEQVLGEIHELLGGSAPSIINAYKGSYNGPGKPFEITNVKWDKDKHESGFASQAFEEGYFSIEVEGNNNKVEIITTPSSMGVAPQMMFLPHDWWWPVERQSIKEVYTRFESWVKDVRNTDWHLDHGHSSKLIDHTPHTTCNVCPKK